MVVSSEPVGNLSPHKAENGVVTPGPYTGCSLYSDFIAELYLLTEFFVCPVVVNAIRASKTALGSLVLGLQCQLRLRAGEHRTHSSEFGREANFKFCVLKIQTES